MAPLITFLLLRSLGPMRKSISWIMATPPWVLLLQGRFLRRWIGLDAPQREQVYSVTNLVERQVVAPASSGVLQSI
eukprot:9487273-Pyramimonas_sp.AAC.1